MRLPIVIFLAYYAGTAFGQSSPRRIALLLGISNYEHLPKLPDVKRDLELMQAALTDAKFEVTVAENATQTKLETEILPGFLGTVKPGDICFFYFAGYATQGQLDNYLLPREFDPAGKTDLSEVAISLTGFQQRLESNQASLKIIALEASRPGPELLLHGIGLTSPDIAGSHEVLFAFSAGPNQTSPDNSGVYTKCLAEAIRKKGLPLQQVFSDVSKQVGAVTGDRQRAFYQPNVTQEFYFHEPEKPKPVEPTVITRTITVPVAETGRKAGAVETNHTDREDYVWIPPGKFKMGCVPGSEAKCKPEEKPQHPVTLTKGFWMGRNEVKTGSYKRFVEADKTKARKMPKDFPVYWENKRWEHTDYPMTMVTQEEAAAYCEWAGGRLPTEAEWEYAARAGKDDQAFPLNDENSRDKANFEGTKGNDKWEAAAPVRSFDPNDFGLFDMAGNVWEWCQDGFSRTYFAESPATDPPGPVGSQQLYVVRGGSWNSNPKEHLRISYREGRKAANIGNHVGFRCMLPDSSKTDELFKSR